MVNLYLTELYQKALSAVAMRTLFGEIFKLALSRYSKF